MKIAANELDRFYAANGVTGACPSCGNTNWAIIDTADNMSFTLHSQPTSGGIMIGGNESIPLIVLACGKCFTLRYHAAMPVRNWLESNPDVNANSKAKDTTA